MNVRRELSRRPQKSTDANAVSAGRPCSRTSADRPDPGPHRTHQPQATLSVFRVVPAAALRWCINSDARIAQLSCHNRTGFIYSKENHFDRVRCISGENRMCFSATANFAGSAVLGTIGVATIVEVKHRRELLFASLPCLFALHQFTEGFVWWGLNGKFSHTALHGVAAAYVLYAQGLLPFLLPLSVLLIGPTRHRRQRMMGFLILGSALALYILWGLMMDPLQMYAI